MTRQTVATGRGLKRRCGSGGAAVLADEPAGTLDSATGIRRLVA